MEDLIIDLWGCIPKFQIAVLKMGGIVNLVFKTQIKAVVLWNEVFCVITVRTLMWCCMDFGWLGLGCTLWGLFCFIFGRWVLIWSDLIIEMSLALYPPTAYWSTSATHRRVLWLPGSSHSWWFPAQLSAGLVAAVDPRCRAPCSPRGGEPGGAALPPFRLPLSWVWNFTAVSKWGFLMTVLQHKLFWFGGWRMVVYVCRIPWSLLGEFSARLNRNE